MLKDLLSGTPRAECRKCHHVFPLNRLLVDIGDRLVPCCPRCRTVVDLRLLSRGPDAGHGGPGRLQLIVPALALAAIVVFVVFSGAVG